MKRTPFKTSNRKPLKRGSFKANPGSAKSWEERTRATMREAKTKPAAIVKVAKRINRVSKKREIQNREYTNNRRDFLMANKYCVPCHDGGTSALAIEVHHMGGREGELLNDTKRFLPVCPDCHRWITANPIAAMQKGYSLSRHRTGYDEEGSHE